MQGRGLRRTGPGAGLVRDALRASQAPWRSVLCKNSEPLPHRRLRTGRQGHKGTLHAALPPHPQYGFAGYGRRSAIGRGTVLAEGPTGRRDRVLDMAPSELVRLRALFHRWQTRQRPPVCLPASCRADSCGPGTGPPLPRARLLQPRAPRTRHAARKQNARYRCGCPERSQDPLSTRASAQWRQSEDRRLRPPYLPDLCLDASAQPLPTTREVI